MNKKAFAAVLIMTAVFIFGFHIKESGGVAVFEETKAVRLPIIMYHSVLKNSSRTGKYTITPQNFEADILYLKSRGYESISAKQLIRYVYSGGSLPEKPVMITFDDGMYNNLEYAVPILEKHGFSAVFSVVGSYTDEYTALNIANPSYGYLRWCDIQSLSKSHFVEFGNHSYDFHTLKGKRYGTEKMQSESTLDYINAFYSDTQKMQSEFFTHCGFSPVIYTYPFGSYSKESARVLKKTGFLITLSCTEGINKIEKNKDCLYMLKRFNRDGRLSSSEFFTRIKF